MNDTKKVNDFLKDLTTLSEKYGIYIKGCGCCGSPWILCEKEDTTYDNLTYTDNGYIVDCMGECEE